MIKPYFHTLNNKLRKLKQITIALLEQNSIDARVRNFAFYDTIVNENKKEKEEQ